MKHTVLRTVAMLGLLLMLAAVSVSAQSGNRLTVSIPFDFDAGGVKLEAGDYSVKRVSTNALLFRNELSKKSVVVLAPISVHRSRTDLPEGMTFRRYGNEYFLAEIWTNQAADGRAFNVSKAEKRLAKQEKGLENSKPVVILARTK